ncbi:MAG: 50S ribosomal protein L4 [Gracilibacteraceae bacterium]|jgi:large subunit ribosomal protein L4|nr:50S ribosomal protein L4 [Gracilibacteraceae bacterium]
MPKVQVLNIEGESVGELEISEEIFGLEPNTAVMHAAVVAQQANARQGTHSTLGRSEVRGGGRKPWRQKGTGRARAGTSRSPLWRGGGVIFGPKPRSYRKELPRKVRRLALCSALSDKVRGGNFIVVDKIAFEAPRTKDMLKVLGALGVNNKALVVLDGGGAENVRLSIRNLPGVCAIRADSLNILEIMKHDVLIFTRDSVARAEEVLGNA